MTSTSAVEPRLQMKEVIDSLNYNLSLNAQFRLDKLFATGMQLESSKRTLGVGKYKYEYDYLLSLAGFTRSQAQKLILLVEVFNDFPTKDLKFVREETLFKLCKLRYGSVVQQMRGKTDLTEAMVQQWIKEVEEPKKKMLPKPKELKTGWQETKDEETKSYAVVQDEETGKAIEELSKAKNLSPQQLTKCAIAEYQKRHIQTVEDYWNAELDAAAIAEAITWEDVERAVNKDKNRFVRAVKNWTQDKKDQVTKTLAAFLSENPSSLADLVWLPTSLVIKAVLRSLLPYDKLAVLENRGSDRETPSVKSPPFSDAIA